MSRQVTLADRVVSGLVAAASVALGWWLTYQPSSWQVALGVFFVVLPLLAAIRLLKPQIFWLLDRLFRRHG